MPTANSHALTIANVTQSITDNKGFSILAQLDHLQVSVDGGDVNIIVNPDAVWNANSYVKAAAGDMLVAGRALSTGQYPTLGSINIYVKTDFTDPYGKKSTEVAASIQMGQATLSQIVWKNIKDNVLVKPSSIYCIADSYHIHPAIWKDLDSGDKGCMSYSSN